MLQVSTVPLVPDKQTQFWKNAIQYTTQKTELKYVKEIAFIMITLHRTGAA